MLERLNRLQTEVALFIHGKVIGPIVRSRWRDIGKFFLARVLTTQAFICISLNLNKCIVLQTLKGFYANKWPGFLKARLQM